MKNGIKQVLIVIKGRFSKEELETFDLIKGALFESGITNYTTVIKTGFDDFEYEDVCNEDMEKLRKETPQIADLIDSCNGIIHVDNPSLTSKSKREDSERRRENSRKKILEHLQTCRGNYKMGNWDRTCVRINDYMNAKK